MIYTRPAKHAFTPLRHACQSSHSITLISGAHTNGNKIRTSDSGITVKEYFNAAKSGRDVLGPGHSLHLLAASVKFVSHRLTGDDDEPDERCKIRAEGMADIQRAIQALDDEAASVQAATRTQMALLEQKKRECDELRAVVAAAQEEDQRVSARIDDLLREKAVLEEKIGQLSAALTPMLAGIQTGC